MEDISDWLKKELEKKEKKRLYMNGYSRKRKKALQNKGICPICEKRPSIENRVCCAECTIAKKAINTGNKKTKEIYQMLLIKQENKCAICNDEMKKPQLDHDHTTGHIRGLLCHNCNIGLGLFKDSKKLLQTAMDYLNHSQLIQIYLKDELKR